MQHGRHKSKSINRFRQWWYELRSSFWFLPALIVIAATVAALLLIEIDAHFGEGFASASPRLFGADAEGSLTILTTIASGMITVAGVVFSITLVALTLAASQYTSRVLRNFMRDRINQMVLGIFLGIFAYCMVVIHSIRTSEEEPFVPSLAVFGGIVLGLVGITLLIYFIHHITTSIQATHILEAVRVETLRTIDHFFPDNIEQESDEDKAPQPDDEDKAWQVVPAEHTGYLQQLDVKVLLAWAEDQGAVITVNRGVGDFVVEKTNLATIHLQRPLETEDLYLFDSACTIGQLRTIEQDVDFGIRQMVDVAMKALSPGINDTTTAVMCVEHLTALLVALADRRISSSHCDGRNEPRIFTHGPSYGEIAGKAFDQIRQHAKGNVAVLHHLIMALDLLAENTHLPPRRHVLLHHARLIQEAIERTVEAPFDRIQLTTRMNHLIARLE